MLLLPYHPPTHPHACPPAQNVLSYIRNLCNVTLKFCLGTNYYTPHFNVIVCLIWLISFWAPNCRQGRPSMPWTGWSPCWALRTRRCLRTHWLARSQHPSFSLQTCSDSCLQWVHWHHFQPIRMSLCSSESMACSTDESHHSRGMRRNESFLCVMIVSGFRVLYKTSTVQYIANIQGVYSSDLEFNSCRSIAILRGVRPAVDHSSSPGAGAEAATGNAHNGDAGKRLLAIVGVLRDRDGHCNLSPTRGIRCHVAGEHSAGYSKW